MTTVGIPASFDLCNMPISHGYTSVLVIPMKARIDLQTMYVLDLARRQSIRVLVKLEDHLQEFLESTERNKQQIGIASDLYPFGLSKQAYGEFCISPHSFLYMGNGKILCGLDMFNRYEIIDLNCHAVELYNPGVDDDWLTASPSYDTDGNLHFGSTALCETIKNIQDPDRQSFTRFWKIGKDNRLIEVWKGKSGALLHQMKVAGTLDGTGSDAQQPPCTIYINKDGSAGGGYVKGGAYVNFTNLKNGNVYKIGPFDVPAHTEVHPSNQNIVFLTEHNFRIESGQPTILGNASVYKFEIGEAGPKFIGKFTHPELYRMTSIELFNRQGAVYMALTGYPDTIFIVNADTLDLVQKIKFRDGMRVDLSNGSFACEESNYGCQISSDGACMFIIESRLFKVYDLETGGLKDEYMFAQEGDPDFAGHSCGFER